MAQESLTSALERLDPASRALLDLSLRRGLQAGEIAEMLGADPGSVLNLREDALAQLAGAIGLGGHDERDHALALLAQLSDAEWNIGLGPAEWDGDGSPAALADPAPLGYGHSQPGSPAPLADPVPLESGHSQPRSPAAAGAPETPRGANARVRDGGRRTGRRRRLGGLLLAAVATACLAAVLLSSSANRKEVVAPAPIKRPAPPAAGARVAPPKPSPAVPRGTDAVRLALVSAGSAQATARLAGSGNRLVLALNGLPGAPTDRYDIWLYNSVVDSLRVGGFAGRHGSVAIDLPAGSARFKSLDVARASRSASTHSGESVLRLTLSRFRRHAR